MELDLESIGIGKIGIGIVWKSSLIYMCYLLHSNESNVVIISYVNVVIISYVNVVIIFHVNVVIISYGMSSLSFMECRLIHEYL